jgi:hypothetical protein
MVHMSKAGQRQFRYAELVGRWRLRVTEEFREFVARSVRERAPAYLAEAALREALHEAEGAEFELCADGRFVSRSHGVELLSAEVDVGREPMLVLAFEKAPGQRVEMRLVDANEVRVLQTGKPEMAFERVAQAAADD